MEYVMVQGRWESEETTHEMMEFAWMQEWVRVLALFEDEHSSVQSLLEVGQGENVLAQPPLVVEPASSELDEELAGQGRQEQVDVASVKHTGWTGQLAT